MDLKIEVDSAWWAGEGDMREEYTRLFNKFVPRVGDPIDKAGRIICFAGRILYDVYNNGGCNLEVHRDAIEAMQAEGIDMDWLTEAMEEQGDDFYLSDEFVDACGGEVDSMMDQAVNIALNYETEHSSKVVTDLEWLRDRIVSEVNGLLRYMEVQRDEDHPDKHWNDEGNKRSCAGWLEDCAGKMLVETLKDAGLDQKTFDKNPWDSHKECMKRFK